MYLITPRCKLSHKVSFNSLDTARDLVENIAYVLIFFLLEQLSSQEWLSQQDRAPIHLSLEKVDVSANHKVLMKDDNPYGILYHQLRPHPMEQHTLKM